MRHCPSPDARAVSFTLVIIILAAASLATAADQIAPERVLKAPPEACALLDDPAKRPLMDGLLLKLLIMCDREHELGQIRQEPAMPPGPEVGNDVLVNDPTGDTGSSHTQSETSIAVSGTTGTICSGYNDSATSGSSTYTGFSRSTDGGATFSDRGGLTSGSFGDPSLVWRKQDEKFYFATLGSGGLRMYVSADDCESFQRAGNITGGGSDDKELMAVDNTDNSPSYGRLYVVWTDFGTGQQIKATYSDDAGATWSSAFVLGSAPGSQGAWPAVAPDGTVYVGWASGLFTGTMSIEVSRSTDGGASWTAASRPASGKVEPRDAAASNNCGRPSLKGNIRYLPSPQLAVGPDGALHCVYSYDPDGYNTGDTVNVYYRRSTNGGATWQPEVLLNDDGTTRDQFFPALSVSATNVVSATWYDRRLDPNNVLIDYYQRFSFDGGATWEPSVRVSDVSSPVYLDPNLATCYHGDYDTHVQTETQALIQWSDDRNIQSGHNDPDVFLDTQPVSTDFLVTADPRSQTVCSPADGVFTINVLQFRGFTEPVTLTAENVPANGTASFSVNPVTPPGTSQLTIGNTAAVAAGSYAIDVTGTSTPGSFEHDTTVELGLFTEVAGEVTLTTPADGALNQPLQPVFAWTEATQAATYDLQIATDPAFTNVVVDATGIAATTHTPSTDLNSNTQYYWRVHASNACGDSDYSTPFVFTTEALPGDCGLGTVPLLELADDFESGAPGWTHDGVGDTWTLSGTHVHGGAFAWHAQDPPTVSDQRLVSPTISLPASSSAPTLQFWTRQEIEDSGSGCYDGGILEITTDGGTAWTQLQTAVLRTDPYDGPISTCCDNPLGTLDAWCGDPQDWLRSVVDLDAYAGMTVQLRFRFGSDSSVERYGWNIDDLIVQRCVPDEPPFFADGLESGDTTAWARGTP